MTDPINPTPTPTPPATGGFDMNQPTIIAGLYLLSFVTGLTALIGVVLAYVWKNEPKGAWEVSHYDYAIRSFWIGFISIVVGLILSIVLIGVFIILAGMVLVAVRSILQIIAAQKREAMPNPASWLI
ncbi:MAG: hypothetical protein IE933_14295 [Sphingomonadales bacterium]|nr:hypothetical protein [Sphingomonadales bacterium]MBD3775223.1 hypothetical protein [Paracoccaceae bacterium]